jgi:serine/threonine-protein kinase
MSHPSEEQLRRCLAAELTPDEREVVEAHVNGCDACLNRLDGLQRPRPAEVRLLAELLVCPPADVAGHSGRNGTTETHAERAGEETGRPLFAGYELLGCPGRGGMGEVYKARHVRSSRVVALKTLAADSGAPGYRERLDRFRTEVEAVSRLQHPNIVSVYDVGDHEGRPYFTMEWLEGGTLAGQLQGAPQPRGPAAECVALLARALQHAHERGVIHRDLKPANVLLQPEDDGGDVSTERHGQAVSFGTPPAAPCVPKIADFGVAKLPGRGGVPTQPCQWLGTPEYMAPEQAGDREAGPATDVYALGVILYEMLTGRPPFRADEPLETLRQVRDDEPVSPRRLRPRLDRDLETICLKCLQKDPARRYPSARDLADDLDRWRTGRAILARPSGAAERAVKWARRHPERAALVGLGAAVVLALAVGVFWQWAASQAGYARQLAASADHQFLLVRYAVGQAARDPALRGLLATPGADRGPLGKHLEATRREFVRWFSRPGENPPIVNWFVMDPAGTILSDSYEDPRSVGINYAFRDYYAGLTGPEAPADPAAVYVSRVYESEQDDRFKLTVISRVWDGDRLLGLLGASLAVDSRMVALDMAAEWPGARLVGPLDRGARVGADAPVSTAPDYVAVLESDYAVPGQKPRPVGADKHAVLGAFAADRQTRQATDWLSATGSLVNYARIGDTHYVAVVERPYPAPVRLIALHPIATAGTLAALAACLGLSRRPRTTP